MKILQIRTKLSSHLEAIRIIDTWQSHLNTAPIEDIVARIIQLNEGLRNFWASAAGWAPIEAAELLSKSRLDWQLSLSRCLRLWVTDPTCEAEMSGRLILAWATLGSLVEGTLKLFLSVWHHDYKADVDAINKKGKLLDPDGLQLEPLRQFFKKKIWDDEWDAWVQKVQLRRNAIHAFKDRDIGSFEEFRNDVRTYLRLLRYVNERLPYPDEETYKPRE